MYHLPDDLKRKLQEKRLIFTVTTGRSGTNYLANMLSYLSNVKSLHEPEPAYHTILRDAQHDSSVAYEFLIDEKLPAIASFDEPIYIETSHLFCKGFFEPLLDLGIVPDLILLNRDKRAVAKSLCQLGHVPGRTSIGQAFLVQPDDPVLLPLDDWDELHDYQLCYWYTLEIERRQSLYGKEVQKFGGQVYPLKLEDFATVFGYWRFINEADLPYPPLINAVKHLKAHIRRVNNKDDLKKTTLDVDYDRLESEVLNQLNQSLRS